MENKQPGDELFDRLNVSVRLMVFVQTTVHVTLRTYICYKQATL